MARSGGEKMNGDKTRCIIEGLNDDKENLLAVENIIKDVLSRHRGHGFHNNRVQADLGEALRLLRRSQDE